jgi:hypothetical protein
MREGCSIRRDQQKLNRDLVGKPKGERPVVRPRGKSEDNIRVDLKEMGW